MPGIETIMLRCLNPLTQRKFYCDILGMREFDDGTVGYDVPEARLEFTQASVSYCPTAQDRYWKITLAVPDIEFAYRQLVERGVEIGEPHQFKNIGYLAHFKDPEGLTIELIDHDFKGERRKKIIDETALGGGAHLNLLTLRTGTIENARRVCIEWGMVPLSIQPVEDHDFTLYFFGFANDVLPNSKLQAIENRPWLYQRPYTVLEFQHFHDKPIIEIGNHDCAGYSGFTIRDGAHLKEISYDINL